MPSTLVSMASLWWKSNFFVFFLSLFAWLSLKFQNNNLVHFVFLTRIRILIPKDCVLCFYCHSQEIYDNLEDQKNNEPAYLSKEFSAWKKGLKCFYNHQDSVVIRLPKLITWLFLNVMMLKKWLMVKSPSEDKLSVNVY